MADLDRELLERAVSWCAEAGRHVGAAEVRRALAPLVWDELLAVRALLADPPPARPLGPHALADLARGAPPDVAAEREREGRYRDERPATDGDDALPDEPGAPPRPSPPARRRRRRDPGVVIRRAKDRVAAPAAAPPPRPDVAELRQPEGRAVLERLVREHGARRAPILAALAVGWTSRDGAAPGDAELSALLDHHGLAHAFERRERDELLHALRAAGGVRTAAAERLGVDAEGLAAALARLGATAQAERIRDERRAELRARATLAERVRLLVSDEARLRDLGLLEEFEADLRARLPEHVRALASGGERIGIALSRSLALPRADAEAVAARFGLSLTPSAAGTRTAVKRDPSRSRPPQRPGAAPRGVGPRDGRGRAPAGTPSPRPGFAPRAGSAPRPGSAARPAGPRDATVRPSAGKPTRGPGFAPRAGSAPRQGSAPRPGYGPRPGSGTRPGSGPRSGSAPRPGSGPRSGSAPRAGASRYPKGPPGAKPSRRPGSAPRPDARGRGRPPRR